MKVSLQQIATPTSAGTINVTDSNINSDWKGAIFWGGNAAVTNTTGAQAALFIGACDSGGRNSTITVNAADATSGGATNSGATTNTCANYIATNSSLAQPNLAYNATLSNGVQLTTVNSGGGARLVNALLFAGADIQFGVGSTANTHLAAGTASTTVTHNLTVVPDFVIVVGTCLSSNQNQGAGTTGGGLTIGFYDGTNSAGFGGAMVNAANPTNVAARCGTSNVGEQISQTPTDAGAWTISSVGTSTLTLTRTFTTFSTNIMVIAVGHNAGFNAAPSAYTDTTPTTTGNNTPSTGTTVPPQLWLSVPTRLTSTSFANTDNAGSWGFSAAVNNNGTTQQLCVGTSFEFNVSASSVAKGYITDPSTSPQACLTLTDTGTVAFSSTLNSWNTTGITENCNTTTGTAGQRINLLYGVQAIPSTPAIIMYERRYVHYYST